MSFSRSLCSLSRRVWHRSGNIRFASTALAYPGRIALVAALLGASSVHAQQASFMGMGYVPGLEAQSVATDISGDGSIVVGRSSSSNAAEHFRWTAQTGMVGLGPSTGGGSFLPQISNDGSTVIGGPNNSSSTSFYRWRQDTGSTSLPLPPAFSIGSPFRLGMTSDGSRLVYSSNTWTQTDGWIRGPNNMVMTDISGDGLSYVGYQGAVAPPNNSGYIWSEQTGVTVLGPTLPNGTVFFNPRAVSADGKVVIGPAAIEFVSHEGWVRWDKDTGITKLRRLPENDYPFVSEQWNRAISADGSTILLSVSANSYIWRSSRGFAEWLPDVLVNEYGLAAQMAGWQDLTARSVSGDGRTIVGDGRNPAGTTEAWIAFLGTPVPEPSSLAMSALALVALAVRAGRARSGHWPPA